VYERQPGWGMFLVRLLTACAAMAAAVLAGVHWAPDFTEIPALDRVFWLGVLVVGGLSVYLMAMLLLGFRLRDLREH